MQRWEPLATLEAPTSSTGGAARLREPRHCSEPPPGKLIRLRRPLRSRRPRPAVSSNSCSTSPRHSHCRRRRPSMSRWRAWPLPSRHDCSELAIPHADAGKPLAHIGNHVVPRCRPVPRQWYLLRLRHAFGSKEQRRPASRLFVANQDYFAHRISPQRINQHGYEGPHNICQQGVTKNVVFSTNGA